MRCSVGGGERVGEEELCELALAEGYDVLGQVSMSRHGEGGGVESTLEPAW